MIEGTHIGLQMNVGDGVSTPVVHNCDVKSLEEIASDIETLTEKARRGGLARGESKGGAITLLDKGEGGAYAFTPIINQPEPAILGIGAIYSKLVMTEKGVENRHFIMQSLTYDQRVLNGTEADEFQRRLKNILENPKSLVG
jgi:pyruvate dehydrogenase E2 component (dihydrolipoamide acetyltransferase)